MMVRTHLNLWWDLRNDYLSGKTKGGHKLQKSTETSGPGQTSAQPDACVKTSEEDSVSTWQQVLKWGAARPEFTRHSARWNDPSFNGNTWLCRWWRRTAQSKRTTLILSESITLMFGQVPFGPGCGAEPWLSQRFTQWLNTQRVVEFLGAVLRRRLRADVIHLGHILLISHRAHVVDRRWNLAFKRVN